MAGREGWEVSACQKHEATRASHPIVRFIGDNRSENQGFAMWRYFGKQFDAQRFERVSHLEISERQ